LAGAGVSLITERFRQGGKRRQAEIAFSSLKRVFGIERALAKTLVGLATRIVAKIAAYTYYLRLPRKPDARKATRQDQGVVGVKTSQHSFSDR